MRLDRQQEEQLAKRRGLTGRTMLQVMWFGLTGVAAYFLTTLIFARYENLYNIFYSQIGLPRSVPTAVIFWVVIILIVLLMQLVFVLGFLLASPEGKRRPGDPSLYSRNPEPFDDRY